MLEFVAELRQSLPFYDKVWRGFRTERYKYTVQGDNMGSEPWQFFDLLVDPCEMNNLVDDPEHRELVVAHHRHLRERMSETGDHFVLSATMGVDDLNEWR